MTHLQVKMFQGQQKVMHSILLMCEYMDFFIQGAPKPKDLEGVEEDQLLDIQRTIQEKLKEKDKERERNITKE